MALFSAGAANAPDWTLAEKVTAQEALLGAGVSAHRLELPEVRARIEAAGALNTVAAAARFGQKVRVAGMRQTWRRTRTVRGDVLYFMSLEDLEGMLDVVIFGDVYRRHRAAFGTIGPYVLEGWVELDPGRREPAIRAERVWRLD
jgi:DNA polymerase-3 subunit alpha